MKKVFLLAAIVCGCVACGSKTSKCEATEEQPCCATEQVAEEAEATEAPADTVVAEEEVVEEVVAE